MKNRIFSILFALSLCTVATSLPSCTKEITKVQMQELNAGSLIWNMALDSIVIEQDHQVFRAKNIVELQDDRIVFYADGTGVRTQGKKLFAYTPQEETLKFEWEQDLDYTNKFYLHAPGKPFPRNEISVNTDLTNHRISLLVWGGQAFIAYFYHQIPQ